MSEKDELAGIIADELNKQFKHQQVAYFLEEGGNPTDVTGWISTGSTMLDLAIANRPNGGVAVGKITELNGLEGSGKSLIGSHLLASTQKKDGIAVYIDTESAVSQEFLRAIGVDTTKMLYVHLETVEEIFDTIETIVTKIRESNKDKLVTIKNNLDDTIKKIVDAYTIIFSKVYVLQNENNVNELICTYNVDTQDGIDYNKVEGTISLHRKKHSNTLYTINALNECIKNLNNGVMDSRFMIPWENFKNMLLITNSEGLNKINTRIYKIIDLEK